MRYVGIRLNGWTAGRDQRCLWTDAVASDQNADNYLDKGTLGRADLDPART